MYNKLVASYQWVQRKLDGVAMYRTVTLALSFLVVNAIVLGAFGFVPYTALEQGASLLAALGTALALNFFCSKLWRVEANHESAVITALIIFFLILPAQWSDLGKTLLIVAAVAIAVLSKFTLVRRKQHLVNPATFDVLALAFVFVAFPQLGFFESSWWIGRPEMFIPLLIAGGAVVIKIRKWVPVLSFLGAAFVVYLFEDWRFLGGLDLASAARFWLSGPSLFLAFFMLTEPFTMPPTKRLQAGYGAVVGFLSQTTIFFPYLKVTPELALILGNLLYYPTTLRRKLILPLVGIKEVALGTLEFSFEKPVGMNFKAGQYLEWMLPHKSADNRGTRRYFTIAAAPTGSELKIGVRFGDKVSSFKTALKAMRPGEVIIASQLAGDFVLPTDPSRKLAFVAGGIGITPFVSQLEDMKGGGKKYDTVLFNCNNTQAEIAYRERLEEMALQLPLKLVNVVAKEVVPGFESGFLTAEIIKRQAPDFVERYWYLSGPPAMVNAYALLLRELGVRKQNIKKDFFPGLA